jgi:hypothetical protein
MSYDLFIAPLGEPPPPGDESFLSLVHSTALACIPQDDERWYVGDADGERFEIEFPLGDADVHADHVALRLRGMDIDTARLIFKIANTTGLDIINDGGRPHFILTDSSRVDSFPEPFRSESPVVCTSSEELAVTLSPNFAVASDERHEMIRQTQLRHSLWTRNHQIRSQGHGDPEPNVPGLTPRKEWHPIYVEVKEAEGSLLRRFGRYLRNRIKAGKPQPNVGVHGSSWQIRLPTGAIFQCLFISGNRFSAGINKYSPDRKPGSCEQVLEEFAKETGRRTAEIEDQRFFVSDGSSYPIEECESRRARDEDV